MHTRTMDRSSSAPQQLGRGWSVALWIVQGALAALFIMAGSGKLAGRPEMVGLFEAIGIGQWFRYFTGGLEVLAAVLLLVPALAGIGAALLAVTMVGAILTHLFVVGGSVFVPAVLLAAAVAVAVGRRERTRALLRR